MFLLVVTLSSSYLFWFTNLSVLMVLTPPAVNKYWFRPPHILDDNKLRTTFLFNCSYLGLCGSSMHCEEEGKLRGGELSVHLVEISEFLFRISYILVFDLTLWLKQSSNVHPYPLSPSKNAPSRAPGVECENMLVQVWRWFMLQFLCVLLKQFFWSNLNSKIINDISRGPI